MAATRASGVGSETKQISLNLKKNKKSFQNLKLSNKIILQKLKTNHDNIIMKLFFQFIKILIVTEKVKKE